MYATSSSVLFDVPSKAGPLPGNDLVSQTRKITGGGKQFVPLPIPTIYVFTQSPILCFWTITTVVTVSLKRTMKHEKFSKFTRIVHECT